MKMHNWIFKNGDVMDIAAELSRLTKCPAVRLVEVAAFISVYRPHDVRFAIGNSVWQDGSFNKTEEESTRLEIWMSTNLGDHTMSVDI